MYTLKQLEACRISVIAMNELAFDWAILHGRMVATIIFGIAESEHKLIQERVRSSLAPAKAHGKRLGGQPGHRPRFDRLAPEVLALVALGRSCRLIGREVGLSKNPLAEIVKWMRAPEHGVTGQRSRSVPFSVNPDAVLWPDSK
jgi:putative DNA-invertase from lambdoid prophage Rac